MSNRGYNETPSVPSNHKDSAIGSYKAFDSHFKTLNNGLVSVAKNLAALHSKVVTLESDLQTSRKSNTDLDSRVANLEQTVESQSKMIAELRQMLSQMPVPASAPRSKDTIYVVPSEPAKPRVQVLAERQQAAIKSAQMLRSVKDGKSEVKVEAAETKPSVETKEVKEVKDTKLDTKEVKAEAAPSKPSVDVKLENTDDISTLTASLEDSHDPEQNQSLDSVLKTAEALAEDSSESSSESSSSESDLEVTDEEEKPVAKPVMTKTRGVVKRNVVNRVVKKK